MTEMRQCFATPSAFGTDALHEIKELRRMDHLHSTAVKREGHDLIVEEITLCPHPMFSPSSGMSVSGGAMVLGGVFDPCTPSRTFVLST
ncbi:hypothetical protein FJ938_27385 [Mesorhizobium sp. B2-4-14]|uniref:hypothetical protein n=1 Tax=Mesorhizobium sp. B2-4-14 TaxID=2589935 RepID=UPI00112CD3DA|nr:hypothetical protein [Mesorhizobium sp. B2-4-14]TPK96300.1 hypothetical protein FJ938_27385 [Mesorhizobium sp. B2-4-14]